MRIEGSDFYNKPEGIINSNIIAENTAILNSELIRKYGKHLGSGLIMGFGDGGLVERFKGYFSKMIIIEGSNKLHNSAVEKYHSNPHILCCYSYFETFELPIKERVDVILGNHVLEHVENPVEVLTQSKQWLKNNGFAIFSVPNANSLHRKIGVKLKMIESRYDLNEQDILVGHQRVYDQKTLLRDVESAGYKIIEVGGFNLKLVSQNQMKDWSQDLIRAIFEVSRECPPNICSNLYVVCKKK